MLLLTNDLSFIDYVSRAGVIVILLIILYGGWRRWWVFGWQYKEVVAEREEWKQAALKSTHVAESAALVGEHLVERNKALRRERE